jgi:hypothetical protein
VTKARVGLGFLIAGWGDVGEVIWCSGVTRSNGDAIRRQGDGRGVEGGHATGAGRGGGVRRRDESGGGRTTGHAPRAYATSHALGRPMQIVVARYHFLISPSSCLLFLHSIPTFRTVNHVY